MTTIGRVVAVCRNPEAGLSKQVVDRAQLIADWGVEGDYHAGKFVRHRYLAKKDAKQPNLRQICIVDAAVFTQLAAKGILVGPGMMGENIALAGLAIMQLPVGTQLTVGTALIELTEIRIPCVQLNGIDARLLRAVVTREQGKKVFLAGMMARILQGGLVKEGDQVRVLTFGYAD
ncbi:MAG: MOSC domain-containing protein [Ktedonobacteraceae bacterium]